MRIRNGLHRAVLMAAAMTPLAAGPLLLAATPTTLPSETLSPGVTTPATQPTTMASTMPTTQGARSIEAIMQEVQALGAQLQPIVSEKSLTDPTERAAAAPKALPLLKQMQQLVRELGSTGGEGVQLAVRIGSELEQYQLIYDDPEAVANAKAIIAGSNPEVVQLEKSRMMFADWVKNSKDAAAQTKILAQAEEFAKAKPEDTNVTTMLISLAQIGPATPELKKRAMDDAIGMNNAVATMAKQQAEADAKLAALENKPLTIKGPLVDGKPFTSDSLKGKVVLVDFWATWCAPCREELPRVKKAYADYHAKGLEVLGVSNDETADDLNKFVAADPGMPWPQLFDSTAKGDWNPITTGYGILGIPTMFLIDKKGVCRSTNARADFEEMIPKLLAE